jgi:hypothetical protein
MFSSVISPHWCHCLPGVGRCLISHRGCHHGRWRNVDRLTFQGAKEHSADSIPPFVRLYRAGEKVDVYPDGLKFGPDRRLYVGEYSAGRILKLDAESKILKTFQVPSAASPNLTLPPLGVCAVAAVERIQTPRRIQSDHRLFQICSPSVKRG